MNDMWTYSTNWMGPINPTFLKEHGDNWAGGRIDCYYHGDDPSQLEECYGSRTELGVPIMSKESWDILTRFLDSYETVELVSFDEISTEIKEMCRFELVLFKRRIDIMSEFKKGQIVYVSNSDTPESYILHHFAGYEPDDAHPYKISHSYQRAIIGLQYGGYKNCLSVEDYHKMINQPKDKDLVWAWDGGRHYARKVGFYDARNNRSFHPLTGNRKGFRYDNYEVIPRDQWPEWAIEAYELLED